MRRVLFNLAAAVSLVTSAAACALWAATARSGWAVAPLDPGSAPWRVVSWGGTLWVDNQPRVEADRRERERLRAEFDERADAVALRLLEARARQATERPDTRFPTTRPDDAKWDAEQFAVAGESASLRAAYDATPKPDTAPAAPLVVGHRWVAAGAAVLPGLWAAAAAGRARTKRRRRAAGLCVGCGYDLTANASGACPECGRPGPAREDCREAVGTPARRK